MEKIGKEKNAERNGVHLNTLTISSSLSIMY